MEKEARTFKLSPSSLNLMNDCERCFWLDKNDVWKRPASGFPTLPSGMDRILKLHFDRFRDQGILPPELRENKECHGCKLFDDKELLSEWRNNFKGVVWHDKEGNILHGAVDNILVKGKKLIVLDYKTRGFPAKENTYESSQNQLNIYNFLLRKLDYETEDFAFLLFYVPREVLKTGEVIFDTQLVKVNTSAENAEKLFIKAIKLLNSPCPKINPECDWCKLVKCG